MEPRLGLGEATGVDLAAGGQEDEEVDQLLVGVGHVRPLDQRPVGELEQDVVVPGDDDVLHPVVVDERLEPAETEQRVEDRPRQRVLLAAGQRRTPALTRSATVASIRSSTIARPSSS